MSRAKIPFFVFLYFVSCYRALFATVLPELFTKYPNAYFIETGTALGNGVQAALSFGFERIYSIELAPHYYQSSCQRFASFPNVTLFQGDSLDVLPKILKQVDAPAT